jgi:hypothetical protein
MIRAILSAVLLICGIADAQQIKRPPIDWKPIIGLKAQSGKFYIDTKSIEIKKIAGGREFHSADIMMSYDKPTMAMTSDKELIIRSKVHRMVVECESGEAAPMADYYFADPMPSRESKPLAADKYPVNASKTKFKLDKESILYKTLCPIYI